MDMHRRAAIAFTACIAGLLGSYLYAGILNPLKVEWLLQESDLLQHYLGWHYYRHESWTWPLGALQTYGTEVRSSIVFTDSLPLLAIPLKLFNNWLPDAFQYQGLASLGHLVLNATAACLLFTRLKLTAIAAIALSLVVAFMPAVLLRGPGGMGHESLMAHWTLLFGLYLLLFANNSRWPTRAKWGALLTAAVLVHFYLFLIAGIFWILWWLLRTLDHWRNAEARKPVQWWWLWGAYSVLQPLIILLIMWAAGYLHSSGSSPGAAGFGFYSAELLTYLNSYSFLPNFMAVSSFMPIWVPSIAGQYEGMSYVGVGVLLLWAVALLLYIKQPLRIPTAHKWQIYGVAGLAIGLFIFALGDKVVIGPYTIGLPLPWPDSLKSILRASGRLAWVLMYLAIIAAALVLARRLSPRIATLAVLVILAIQTVDLYLWHQHLKQQSQQAAEYRMEEDPRFAGWQNPELQQALSQRQTLHITHADDIVGMLPIAWLAGQHHMAINVAYVARITLPIIHRASAPSLQALEAGQPDPSVVYAISSPEAAQQTCNNVQNLRCIETPITTFAWQPTYEDKELP